MAQRRVRVGMVGLGNVSLAHEAGYAECADLAEIVAVCDIDEVHARNRAEPLGASVYADYRDLVSDENVDLVDITVPHHLHFPVAMAALEQGKHVLVEKPICISSAEGSRLIEKAREAGVKFTVAENSRFVPVYHEVAKHLAKGLLGEIWLVRTIVDASDVARIRDPGSWAGKKLDHGVILDCGVHSFYLLKWLFGGVREVRGISHKIVPEGETEDNAVVVGRLVNGASFLTVLSSSTEIPPVREVLEVFGSRGGILVDLLRDRPAIHYAGSTVMEGTLLDVPHDPMAWKVLSMVEEVKAFVRAVVEDGPVAPDPNDALHAVKVVEAIYASMQENQFVAVAP